MREVTEKFNVKEQRKENKKRVMLILADVFYDRKSIPCDELLSRALFLYQNAKLGPKGTKMVAGYLCRIDKIIQEKKSSNPSILQDENGKMKCLGEIDCYGHVPVVYDIAALSLQMRQNFENIHIVNRFIILNMYLSCCNSYDKKINTISKHQYRNFILSGIKKFVQKPEPGDIYLQWKYMNSYFEKNQKVQIVEEPITEEVLREQKPIRKEEIEHLVDDNTLEILDKTLLKAEATIGRLKALKEMTLNSERKKYLENCIFDLEAVSYADNVALMETEILDAEEIFVRSVRRKRN